MIHSSYLRHIVSPKSFRFIVKTIASMIRKDMRAGLKVDAIAVRGISGATVGASVSIELGLPLIVVRKPDENSHSSYTIECDDSFVNYIVIDDLVSTGKTIDAIMNGIAKEFDNRRQLVKIYLYHDIEDPRPTYCNGQKVPVAGFQVAKKDTGRFKAIMS